MRLLDCPLGFCVWAPRHISAWLEHDKYTLSVQEVRVRSEACSLLEIQLKKTQQERDDSAAAERHLRSKLAELAETVDGLSRDNKEVCSLTGPCSLQAC